MESWRKVWRDGLAKVLTRKHLESLRDGLLRDDARIIQGATTSPPPMLCVQDWPVEATCVIGFCAWQGDGLGTVGQVEEFFAETCSEIDEALKEPAACRYFLNWYDDAPRDEMRRELIDEIAINLKQLEAGEMSNATCERGCGICGSTALPDGKLCGPCDNVVGHSRDANPSAGALAREGNAAVAAITRCRGCVNGTPTPGEQYCPVCRTTITVRRSVSVSFSGGKRER